MNTARKMIRQTEKAAKETEDYIALCRALDNPLIIAFLKNLHDNTFDGNVREGLAVILKHIAAHRE